MTVRTINRRLPIRSHPSRYYLLRRANTGPIRSCAPATDHRGRGWDAEHRDESEITYLRTSSFYKLRATEN